ncbi:MAG TPA: hypothetical protein VFX22_03435 [Candidatus Kapabacteria bacterium]|nr:hypothetical protein [Candidatus Kapabacteria bacterium]
MTNRINQWAIGALAIAALVQIVGIGILPFHGYDSPFHIFWIGAWHKLWDAGIFYPRWLPASYRGFGAPSFYFYAPLTFIWSSAIYWLMPGADAATVAKVLIAVTLAASGATMWLYLRQRPTFSRSAAVCGALLFTFAPYRYYDYSVRSALSEHVAFVFVPLAFWGMEWATSTDRSTRNRGLLLLTLSIALLFVTNLASAVAVLFGLGIVAIVKESNSRRRNVSVLVISTVAAGLLACFYLLPTVILAHEVQLDRLWQAPSVLLSSPLLPIFIGRDVTASAYNYLAFFAECALILSVVQVRQRFPERSDSRILLWTMVFILVMDLPYVSRYLFNFVPPFTIVQRPERLSILLLVLIAITWKDSLTQSWTSRTISFIVIGWSIGVILLICVQFSGFRLGTQKSLPVDDGPGFAPRWSRPYYDFGAALSAPFASDSQYVIWRGVQSEAILRDVRQPYSDSITYNSPVPGSLLLRRSYWSTWKASLDGTPTTTEPDSLGRLIIRAPQGQHHVVVSLATENSARIGAWISVGTVIILCAIWILA